ncbi:MAG: ATP-binding cassette domain-containing protein [bacterium]|nr:ATP-binding cassette domain-containing protein [bacterium]
MIQVESLHIQLGKFELQHVSFEVNPGEYAVLMGRTGCGKTTILEAICGLRPIVSGRILLNGADATRMKPAMRGIGLVPQDGALFSTLTVREQLAFALTIRGWKHDAIKKRVDELAELLGVTHLLDRGVHGLSGGERQRTALGRALAFHPRILCLDEPMSALDDETRDGLCSLLKDVQSATGACFLHITHHRDEAHALGDRILRMEDGAIREIDQNELQRPNAPLYSQSEIMTG